MHGIERRNDEIRLRKDLPAPSPGPNEVLIRPIRVAVTPTDVEIARGLFGFEGVLGRNFVGVVEDGGDGVERRLVGSRVACAGMIACGSCDLCRGGLGAHCRDRRIPGAIGADGGLAERICLPLRAVTSVPDALDDDQASMLRLVAEALHATRRVRFEGKPFISVLGDGPSGMVTAQLLARLNASVRVLGRFSEKLDLCERWGIKHRHIDDVGRRADQDVVVDCTDTADGLSHALGLVRPLGKIIATSLASPETIKGRQPAVDMTELVAREIELIGCFGGSMSEAAGILLRREVDVVSLFSRRARIDEGIEILRAAARPESLVVLVEF